jgi:hypothetical protein
MIAIHRWLSISTTGLIARHLWKFGTPSRNISSKKFRMQDAISRLQALLPVSI